MKRALVLPALLLLASCGDSPSELHAKASQAFAAHDYTAARLHLASALAEEPGNRAMLLLQARTLLALGDGEGARVALEKLTGGKPATGELAELSALAALLRRKPDIALGLLEGTGSVEADRLRAVASLQKQDIAAADGFLAKAVAAGGNGFVFADYARVHLIQGHIADAEAMAAQAAKLAPDETGALLIRGELAARRGDLADALAIFTRADKLYPDNIAAMVGKASVLGELGRLEELEAALKPLVETIPNDADVIYLQARLAYGPQNWKRVPDLLQAVETGISPPRRILAEAQLSSGDARSAGNTLGPIAQSVQARPDELALMARIAKAGGDQAAADRFAAQASRPSPQSIAADLAEGDAAMRSDNWARAATAYGRILAVTDGRNALVLNNMAFAQSMLGNHAKAVEFGKRALQLAPGNPSVMDTAGWVQLRAGQNLAEARSLIAAAAEKAPGNESIRRHLEEARRSPG